MKRTRKKIEVLRQSDNVQATRNDSSDEEFAVEEVKPRLLGKKRKAVVEDKEDEDEDEEEKKLNKELSGSGCGTDFTDMTKEEKQQLIEAIRASKKEYAQEEELHHLHYSQEEELHHLHHSHEEDLHHLHHSQEDNATVPARQKQLVSKTSAGENPDVISTHSAPDGSGDCTRRPPDVAGGTETPKKLRLRRRAVNAPAGEGGSCGSVSNAARKRPSEVPLASISAKVLKTTDESHGKLDPIQTSQSDGETQDCVALIDRVKISAQHGDVVHAVTTRARDSDTHQTQDGVTVDGDASSSDDSSVIFEKMVTPKSDKVHSEVQQSQDLFSDDDSPGGGATSQAAADGSQSRCHGNRYDNEASQEKNSVPKGEVGGPQKRKLVPQEDGPSAKRPFFWAWDYLQKDELPENIPPESPSLKLVNKRALKKKLYESRRYFAPPGVSTSQCTQRIIEFFREDQTILRRLQDRSVAMVPWGPPVRVGCHMTSTIELRRPEEETSVDRVGVSKRLRRQNNKIEGPNSDEEFSALGGRDDNSPQIVLDSDNDASDKDVDWMPDLKDCGKKRAPVRARKPANKTAKMEKKVQQDENENFDSIPDTPPGEWLKSPAAQKVQNVGNVDRKVDVPRKQMDLEETSNSVLMLVRTGAKDAVPAKATRRLGVTRQRGTAKRKVAQGGGRQSKVKMATKTLRDLFADDEDSSGEDSDGKLKLKLKCEQGNRNYEKGSKKEGVGLEEHPATSRNASGFDGYFRPVAKIQRKLPSRHTDDGMEVERNQVQFQVVATETNTVVMDTSLVGRETSPVAQEISPVAKKTSSVVKETSPVVMRTSPVVMETSPVVMETTPVVKQTRTKQKGRVISAVASIARSVVSGATNLLRGAGRTGRGGGRGGGKGDTQGTLFEISSSEDDDLEQQQQQQQQQQPGTPLEVEHKKQQAECPMCFKYFPLDGIEEHAFSCQGEDASSSSKQEGVLPVPPAADVISVGSLARKPLRQYGRQRVRRGHTDDLFDCVLEEVPVKTAVGRWRQVTQHPPSSDTKQAQDTDDVEILSDSDIPNLPTGRQGKGNIDTPGQEEGHPCPICAKWFSESLIEAHVLRCLETAETEKRVTRSRRHPDHNGIPTTNRLTDDDFDENMPINPKKRQTYLHKKQTQPLITSKLKATDVDSTSNNFRKYSSIVNTLKSSSNDDSDSDSDTASSSSISRNFSDDSQTSMHSGISKRNASPFRTFKRISDQASATLDYHNQFRKGDIEKARKKSEARVNKTKRRTRKRKGRQKKGAPRKKRKLT